MPRVVVVGLGPAGADLLVPRARAAIDAIPVRFARTARHPAVADLTGDGVVLDSFDDVYESADVIDEVYPRIVDALLTAAHEHGEVLYAVPGNPVVAERSVALLQERARAGEVALEIVPGVSFAELAWARVGVDPLGGARVVDGRALDPAVLEAGGPLLIAQIDGPLVASDVKLALLDHAPPDTPVTVLQRLGLADEAVRTVALVELDRAVEPDHLTTVYVELPAGAADRFAALIALARRLRGPGGCPWDAEQTHHSLTRYLLEEAYEVADAIAAVPADEVGAGPVDPVDPRVYADLVDELGDLLFQVVFHGVLGEEAGEFTIAEVAQGIREKLIRRHPHVFADVDAPTPDDVMRNWEQIKKGERGSDSLVDSVSPGLPALLATHKLFRKAASVGLDLGEREEAVTGLARAAAQAAVLGPTPGSTAEVVVGDALAAAVQLASDTGVDAEAALRAWAGRFRAQFRRMEERARADGVDLHTLPPDAVTTRWAECATTGTEDGVR